MGSILNKILNMGTINLSRKFVDGLLSLGTKRIEFELMEYLCEKGSNEYLKIVLFDFYLYCYIYQYGKFKYDSCHHKWDFIYLKQSYVRYKYGTEEASMVMYKYVEPKIKMIFNHFCNSLIEEEIVNKEEFVDFIKTESFSIAPPMHMFEGLWLQEILYKQGSDGIEDYLKSKYSNSESVSKFPNHKYYKSYFNQ